MAKFLDINRLTVAHRSATLNPDGLPFCLDNHIPVVSIPLRFNQTTPRLVELLRIDFETNTNETISLSSKELRKRVLEDDGISVLTYAAKKPGLYRLFKVVDETKLEVQRRMSDTLVTICPKAVVKSSVSDKCTGDLSDLIIEATGTPPLTIVYSRAVNNDQSLHHFQGIQPDNFESPLLGSAKVGTIVKAGDQDVSWARAQTITIPLNETMISKGDWVYSIDEIHDAIGNVAKFTSNPDDGERHYPKGTKLKQEFTVHDRPLVNFGGCDSRKPLMVAKGNNIRLPVKYQAPGTSGDTSYTFTWKFSPLDTLTKAGDHGDEVVFEEHRSLAAHDTPIISEPGLYTLTSVQSKFCDGEIQEPTSCLLLNPPEPELSITAESISDKCAGQSIGLLVLLDLVGTPPFVVRYDTVTRSGTLSEEITISSLRHQFELKPKEAGHFKYHFTSLDDAVYDNHSLAGQGLVLEQDVKPPAAAYLRQPSSAVEACIEEQVEMNVELFGEKPFALEYELVHEGKRKKEKVVGIESDIFTIKTAPLEKGGDYTLALTSVQDKTGCKIFSNSVVKFKVQRQRPSAAFGYIDGKQSTVEVEGKKIPLPLKLTGQPPFNIKYRNVNHDSGKTLERTAASTNDKILVRERGMYEILEVSDRQCPGTVIAKASTFDVSWFARPQIKFPSTTVIFEEGGKHAKREVCEGDIDAMEVSLHGMKPLSLFIPLS